MVVSLAALPYGEETVSAKSVTARLSAQDQTVHRGQTFDVDVDLADNTGLLTLYLTVKFDHSVFKLINVRQIRQALGELNMEHSGSGYDYVDEKTGGFNLFWDGSRADATSGTIVRLTFQSSLNAPIGIYPIELVVDDSNTTVSYGVQANVEAVSPNIELIEGAYVVVWHDWDGKPVENNNISGHPYNAMTGGYEYASEDTLDTAKDFPAAPSRAEDDMYTYEFIGWEGAVWRGDVPQDSSVIYYMAKYAYNPKIYTVWYYVDGVGEDNAPDGEITDEELYTAKSTAYDGVINDSDIPYKPDYTFYGWFTDKNFTRRLVSPLMPAKDVKLYGYFKYNIRETDVPQIKLVYRETITNGELEEIAYVDVDVTKNYGLSSLLIKLSDYDRDNFTFVGYEKGGIFKQMSFFTSNDESGVHDDFAFSWNNSNVNSYETGTLLVLKFKVAPTAEIGAYKVSMTADTQNTTYVNDGEIWYSDIEFIDTKIPIGETNRWLEPVPSTEVTIEVQSAKSVPYNVELVVMSKNIESVVGDVSLKDVLDKDMMVYSLFEIYFRQNAEKLSSEEYRRLFGDENVVVKIKLTALQLSCKQLDIYYVDDEGGMQLYESKREDGYLVFETNHFSHWALVGDYALTNVETGSVKLLRILLILFGISASALISITFVRNRKKRSLIVYSNNTGGNQN